MAKRKREISTKAAHVTQNLTDNRLASRWVVIGVSLLLAALTIGAYASLTHAGFILVDDDEYVERNPHILGGLNWPNIGWALTHQHSAMYHPLTTLSHMADVQFFGLSPGAMHLVNILIHAANAVLLFIALRRLTKTLWPSAFVAAIFALHPQHVESVAWISERKDVLSGFFFMLCLLAYEWYVRRPSWGRYLLLAALFVLSLLSKPMMVTLPIVLLILDFWPLERTNIRKLILEKLPLFAISGTFAFITLRTQHTKGAMVLVMPLWDRIANALLSYMRYVGIWFWPSELSFFYPLRFPFEWPAVLIVSSAIALLIFTLVLVIRFRRRALLAGWAWFVVMLLPVIGLVQVGLQAMADRYSYLPSIGLTIAVVWLAMELIPFARFKLVTALCAGTLLAVCLLRTVAQVQNWRDQELLYTASLESVGESSFLRNVLAWVLFQKERPDEAVEQFERVLQYEPNNQTAHAKLGAVLLHEGRVEEAHEHLVRASQLNPEDGLTLIFLAGMYQAEGNLPAAIESARKAVQLDPTDVDANEVLSKLLAIQQRASGSIPPR